MAASPKTTVTVTFDNGKVHCDKAWVRCYWNVPGEEDIRWTFKGFPPGVTSVAVDFMSYAPSKCFPLPDFIKLPVFLSKPPFRGFRAGVADGGLPDLFTYGNRLEQGFFYYTLRFFDAAGKELYCCDPGGTSDPDPPEGP